MQKPLFEFCKKNGISFTAYGPLGAPERPTVDPKDPVLLKVGTSSVLLLKYTVQRRKERSCSPVSQHRKSTVVTGIEKTQGRYENQIPESMGTKATFRHFPSSAKGHQAFMQWRSAHDWRVANPGLASSVVALELVMGSSDFRSPLMTSAPSSPC